MRLISFIDGAHGYCALLGRARGRDALLVGDGEPVERVGRSARRGGPCRLDAERGPLEISWSPAGPMLEFAIDPAVVTLYGIAASGSLGRPSALGARGRLGAPGRGLLGAAHDLGDHGEERPARRDLAPPRGRPRPRRGAGRGGADHGPRRALRLRRAAALDRVRRGRAPIPARRSSSGPRTTTTRRARRRSPGLRRRAPTPEGRLEAARFAWSLGGDAGRRRLRDPDARTLAQS